MSYFFVYKIENSKKLMTLFIINARHRYNLNIHKIQNKFIKERRNEIVFYSKDKRIF